jgi:hypothetical protein
MVQGVTQTPTLTIRAFNNVKLNTVVRVSQFPLLPLPTTCQRVDRSSIFTVMTYQSSGSTATASAAAAGATFSAPPGTQFEGSGNATVLVAGKGEVIVAPRLGVLKMVPFAMNMAKGQDVTFVWGAGASLFPLLTSSTILT